MERNLAFRLRMAEMGGNDARWASAFVMKGEFDPIWWLDAFGWTQNPKDFPDDPRQPIILWPKQENYVRFVVQRIGKRPVGLGKSREQGASVITANIIAWLWRYKPLFSCLIGSRKLQMVDGGQFSQSMPKIDYTIDSLPEWASPSGYKHDKPHRKMGFMRNPENKATIQATTTSKFAGVGERHHLIWMDEPSKIPTLPTIHKSVANATNCFLYTSTPEGWEKFAEIMHDGSCDTFELHWTDNPLWLPRGYGEAECDWKGSKLWPVQWLCKRGECKLARLHADGGMPHSERFDFECAKFGWDDRVVAQELEIDYQHSGGSIFPARSVARGLEVLGDAAMEFDYYKMRWELPKGAKPPAMTFDAGDWFGASQEWSVKADKDAEGEVRVWKLPDPSRIYCVGADCARGLAHGDYDVLPVTDLVSGELVAEVYGKFGPSKLGPLMGMLCRWYGVDSGCVMNALASPENNADGLTVARTVMAMGLLVATSQQSERTQRGAGARHLGIVIGAGVKRRYINTYLVPLLEPDPDHGLPWGLVIPFREYFEEFQTFVQHTPEGTTGVNPDMVKVGGMRGAQDDRVMGLLSLVVGACQWFGGVKGIDPRDWVDDPRMVVWDRNAQKALDMARVEETARRTALGLPRMPWMPETMDSGEDAAKA